MSGKFGCERGKDIKRVKRGRGSVRVCVCVGMKERVSGKKWRIHTAESERLVVCSRLCECVHEKRERVKGKEEFHFLVNP